MRTTLDIDDHLLERARKLAKRSKLAIKDVIGRALSAGLEALDPASRRRPYRCTTYRMGFPPALNLDKASQIAAMLEDEESARELQLRK
jgi:hypothetical protein